MAREAVVSGEMVCDGPFKSVQAFPSDDPNILFAANADTTGSPMLGDQVRAGLEKPLLKKLNGQFRKAKDAGFPTALLLDQVPPPGMASDTIWGTGPTSIAEAVASVLREHSQQNPKVLDQVWLRPAIPGSPLLAPSIHLLIA